MTKPFYKPQVFIFLFITVGLFACSNRSETDGNEATKSYTDPFSYCAAVGTIDAPDNRYSGPEVPQAIAQGLRKSFDTPDTPLDVYMRGTFWRCMNGKVYACNVGANLPCEAKADTDRMPTQAVTDFCQQNPDTDVIPMYVTGRETVYEWRCSNGTPRIVRELVQPDGRGFLSNIWYEVTPD